MVSCRPTLAGALILPAVLLFGSLSASAASPASPAVAPDSSQLGMAWSAPRLSISTPAEQIVAAGSAHEQARGADGQVHVLSVHRVDGRPQVSTTAAADEAAAVREVAARQQDPDIVSVEIDVPRQLSSQAAARATDPYRGEQWGLDTLGVEQVWGRSTGSGVVVAVIDTGVDASHPDLAGRVLPGAAFPADGRPGTHTVNPHGTHVAGIAVATAGNGVGIAGVAPGARVLPVRTFDETGWADTSALVQGITYAVDQGADVINMSYTAPETSDAERVAVDYARSRGVVLFAAGGNTGGSDPVGTPVYPAALPGVIGVSNEDVGTGRTNPISNAGTFIDVSAPGTDILSTMPGGRYERMTGTSMASPAAAGVAALLLSARPQLTATQVEQALVAGATDLDRPGYDLTSGFGRVFAPAALRQADCIAAGGCAPAQNPLTGNINQSVVNRAYAALLGRPASGADLWTWGARLDAGTSPVNLGRELANSAEFRQDFLVRTYQTHLGRTPQQRELSGWLTAMDAGRSQPQVQADFLGSPEFYARNGSSTSGFVTALYRQVLGRAPSQGELAHWTRVLASGTSRTQVALGFTAGPEHQDRQVQSWYRTLLGRAASAAEAQAARTQLASGGRIEDVIAGLVGHGEVRAMAGRTFGPTGFGLRPGNSSHPGRQGVPGQVAEVAAS